MANDMTDKPVDAPGDSDAEAAVAGNADTDGNAATAATSGAADGESTNDKTSSPRSAVSLRGQMRTLLTGFAAIVAVIALLVSGSLWWQYRQFYVELADDDEGQRRALEETRAAVRRLDDEIIVLQEVIAEGQSELRQLDAEVDVMPAGMRALERRLEALQGGELDAADEWLRAQTEYFLVLANTELTLGRRIDTAVEALEAADDRILELADPGLVNVRASIAADIQALEAIERPDLSGLAIELSSLGDRAANLPLREARPGNFIATEESLEDMQPGFDRLWARLKGAVLSVVRVERQDAPEQLVLTDEERRVVRRQLMLELTLARSALLSQRPADFRSSLVAADGILNRDFDHEAQSVIAARELLADLMRTDIAPELPRIAGSLLLFRSASGVD